MKIITRFCCALLLAASLSLRLGAIDAPVPAATHAQIDAGTDKTTRITPEGLKYKTDQLPSASDLATKADVATTLAGYGITDAIALPADQALSGSSPYTLTFDAAGNRSTGTLATDSTINLTPGTSGWSKRIDWVISAPITLTIGTAVVRNGASSTTTSIPVLATSHYRAYLRYDGSTIYWDDNITFLTQDAQFIFPCWGDGVGSVRITVEGAGYGHFTMSGSAAKAGNYVVYRWEVPKYFDATAVMSCVWSIKLTGADTAAHAYEISVADVAPSADVSTPTPGTAIALTISADGSGASGDLEQTSLTTLTGWAAALMPGHIAYIRVARVGDTDASTVASQDINLTIYYGVTQ